MTRHTAVLVGLVSAPLWLAACDGDTSVVEDDFTQTKKLTLIEGPDLVSCHVVKGSDPDPFFRTDEVRCTRAKATSFPLQPAAVLVSVATKSGQAGSVDLTGDAELVVAKVAANSYPLTLEVVTSYAITDAGDLRGLGSGFFQAFTSSHSFVAPTGEPVLVRFPFDLWPVEVRATKARFEGSLTPYQVDLSPMKTSSGASTLEVRASLGSLEVGGSRASLLPVTRGTQRLPGEGRFDGQARAFELAGPGIYVAEPSGLRGATEADLDDVSSGPPLAACWTATAEGGLEIRCQSTSVAGFPIDALEIGLAGADNGAAIAAEGVTLVGVVAASDLPIALWARVTPGKADVGGLSEWQLGKSFVIGDELTSGRDEATPLVLRMPFDVWPITVDAAEGSFLCDLPATTIPLSTDWGGSSVIKVENLATPFIDQGDVRTFYLAADSRTTSLDCNGLIVSANGDVVENLPVKLTRGVSLRVGAKAVVATP